MAAQTGNNSSNVESTDETTVNVSDLSCFSCKKVYQQIDCYSCFCSETTNEGSTEDLFYCDLCIGSHIRQDHEVLDYKGCKLYICPSHKMLSSLFCFDCDVVFCFKCLGPHRKHDYRSVSEKAQEVRKSVFEYLNQFDELAKPLARRKSFVENCVQRCEELYPNMCTENFIDDLCNRFERVLRSNASKWQEIVEIQLKNLCERDNIFDIMDRADIEVVKLRQLLSMSDSACVSTFLGDETAVKASLKEQKSELDKCQVVEWSRDLDSMIEEWVKDLLESWNIPVVKREEAGIIECHEIGNSASVEVEDVLVLDLKVTATSVCFNTLGNTTPESDDENDPELSILKHHFDIPDVVRVHSFNGLAAFVTSENHILVYDLKTKSQVGMVFLGEHIEMLAFQGRFPPFNFFRLIGWNSETSVIQLLHNKSVVNDLPCESKPKIVECQSNILAFVSKDNEVTVVELNQMLKMEILPHHHGLQEINRLSLYTLVDDYGSATDIYITLFDYKSKTVAVSSCSLENRFQLHWRLERIYKFELDGAVSAITLDSSQNEFFIVLASGKIFVLQDLDSEI